VATQFTLLKLHYLKSSSLNSLQQPQVAASHCRSSSQSEVWQSPNKINGARGVVFLNTHFCVTKGLLGVDAASRERGERSLLRDIKTGELEPRADINSQGERGGGGSISYFINQA
jgi:hypothetical protein